MLDRILSFFNEPQVQEDTLTVDEAAAVLLIEVMLADYNLDERERERIREILSRRLNAPEAEIENCINAAIGRQRESNDLYQFTKVINKAYGEQQRYELIVDLWRVAFADGELDKYEDHSIRKVNELLFLHHSHFIKAKSAAMSG